MSKKRIMAGDTLTVGDLTDDYIGASIEVGTLVDVTYKFAFGGAVGYSPSSTSLWTPKVRVGSFYNNTPVTIITPPPVVQPDEPTEIGQCIRIEGDDRWLGIVADTQGGVCRIWDTGGYWFSWDSVRRRADDRQIIVSDPPRWPDDTEGGGRRLLDRLHYHGLAGLLVHAGWPASIGAAIEREAVARAMWELRHRQVMARLLGALDKAKVPALLLKGTAYAYRLYDEPAFLRGQTKRSLELSPIRIVRAPDGTMNRAAMSGAQLAKDRREARDQAAKEAAKQDEEGRAFMIEARI